MRALLPRGPREWSGAGAIADQFASWFAVAEDFDVIGTGVDEIGARVHLRWRLRARPTPRGPGWHEIEQHAYVDVTDAIDALDLLCSGFNPVSDG